MKWKIPLFKSYWEEDDIDAISNVIRRGTYWSTGPEINKFENKLSNFIGTKHALSFNSGTSALHAILLANDVINNEVIVPSFTFISTANSVVLAGAKPIFAEIEDETYGLDPENVKEKITRKTKAIIPVHYGGGNCKETKALHDIADDHKILLIEDAAESLGSKIGNKMVGSFGQSSIFSFCQNKIITCFPPKTHVVIKHSEKGRGGKHQKKIENIIIGDDVLSYNETNGIKEYKKVTNVFKRMYNGKLIKLKLSNGNEISATPEHPIFVVNNKWKKINKIKVGDDLIQFRYAELGYTIKTFQRRGKKYSEIYGLEKAEKITNKKSRTLKKIHNNPNSGFATMYTDEWKKKIGLGNKGKTRSQEVKDFLSNLNKKRWMKLKKDKEKFEKWLYACKKSRTEESIGKMRRKILKLCQYPEYIKIFSEKSKENWQDPVYAKKVADGISKAKENPEYWKNYARGMKFQQNKSELFLQNIINECCPNEFEFNGDYSLGVTIDGFIPDFVNTNGKKKIIEFFGSYWHDSNDEHEKKKRYKKCGFDCLVIWGKELKNIDTLKEKIKTFVYNPRIEIVKVVGIEKLDYNGFVYNLEVEHNNNYFAYGILVHNCGEGGAAVTDSEHIYQKLKLIRSHGRLEINDNYFSTIKDLDYMQVGYNYRMSSISAALALSQLKKINKIIKIRREKAEYFNKKLSKIKIIKIPRSEGYHVYQLYTIQLEDNNIRDKLQQNLAKAGIMTKVYFNPVHLKTFYKEKFNYKQGDLPNTEKISKIVLTLPLYPSLTIEDMKYVIDEIKKAC